MEKRQEQAFATEDPGPARELTSIRFAQIARQLNRVAADHDLRTPAFRSPPRARGLQRSIKRRPDGSATVAVSLRGRPAVAVVADMIDGVMAANASGSTGPAAIRDRLWSAATPFLTPDAGRAEPRSVRSPGGTPRQVSARVEPAVGARKAA